MYDVDPFHTGIIRTNPTLNSLQNPQGLAEAVCVLLHLGHAAGRFLPRFYGGVGDVDDGGLHHCDGDGGLRHCGGGGDLRHCYYHFHSGERDGVFLLPDHYRHYVHHHDHVHRDGDHVHDVHRGGDRDGAQTF